MTDIARTPSRSARSSHSATCCLFRASDGATLCTPAVLMTTGMRSLRRPAFLTLLSPTASMIQGLGFTGVYCTRITLRHARSCRSLAVAII